MHTGGPSTGDPAATDGGPPPVSRAAFLRLFGAVMLPIFLAAADQTLLATATPAIAAELGHLRDAPWIALAYLIAITVTVPLYGRLGDRHGRGRVLLAALALFAAGAAAGALAQSMLQLVLARVVQGLGGGGLMVLSQALIGERVPPRERPRFQTWFTLVLTSASLAGPLLGGLIVGLAGWRWVFAATLALAMLAALPVARLPLARGNARAAPFSDGLGLLLFAACSATGLACLTLGGHRIAWTSAPALALAAAALIAGAWLLVHERRHRSPFLPVELLRVHGAAGSAATVGLFAAAFFGCLFFLPLYLRLATGSDAARAGLLLLPLTLGMALGAIATGRLVARSGRPTLPPRFGLLLSAGALFALGLLPPTTPVIAVLGVACGLGFGSVMPTATLTVQSLAGRDRLGAASSLVSLARSVGGVLGTAAFGALAFGLLPGTDLDAALRGAQALDPARVGRAFQAGFVAAGAVALAGALVAWRLPDVRL